MERRGEGISSDDESGHEAKKAKKEAKKSKKEKHSKKQRKEPSNPPNEKLDSTDFYLKAAQFKLWLKEDRDIAFDSLAGKESRALFEKFVKRWNLGSLSSEYYSTQPPKESVPYSQHKWGFAAKLSARDEAVLTSTKDSVLVATHSSVTSSAVPARAMSSAARDHLDSEKLKMDEFRRSMGLQPGQKITIAPRPESETQGRM
jgi:hypothetical protein